MGWRRLNNNSMAKEVVSGELGIEKYDLKSQRQRQKTNEFTFPPAHQIGCRSQKNKNLGG
jgi:hypothetical protein